MSTINFKSYRSHRVQNGFGLGLRALVAIVGIVPQLASAALDTSVSRGEQIVEHPVKGRRAEVCVIPKHFENGKYSKKDAEHEAALCQLESGTNAAVCPKLESSNPGLNWFLVESGGPTAAEMVADECYKADPDSKENPKDNAFKKVAKYKLSTSCSYTPSIIGYYHVSRLLGDIGNVPVAVLRTFDLQNHRAMAEEAYEKSASFKDPTLHATWGSLKSVLDAGKSHKRADFIFTSGYDQSYGGLQKNPSGEAKYSELFNRTQSKDETRAMAFRDRNPVFKVLSTQKSLESIVPREFNRANVQLFQQLKDVSDMIVIDTIMSQEDRFGNIHYYLRWVYRDANDLDKDGNPKIKSKRAKNTPESEMTAEEHAEEEKLEALGAVKIKEMLLKDNDCGVNRTNHALAAELVHRIAHIDPSTYKGVMRLNKLADDEETREVFARELLFTGADWKLFRKNLKTVADSLETRCKSGELRVDLNLEDHLAGKSARDCKY